MLRNAQCRTSRIPKLQPSILCATHHASWIRTTAPRSSLTSVFCGVFMKSLVATFSKKKRSTSIPSVNFGSTPIYSSNSSFTQASEMTGQNSVPLPPAVRTELFPPLEPSQTGRIQVSSVHSMYWEESGNPNGQPVVFLHGGPGGGTSPDNRRFFDPQFYRIFLLDQVFGGSWGSTLALTYAQAHPERVCGLVLRGIFLVREKEIEWFYQKGANTIFPDEWEGYCEAIPEGERDDFVGAYHKRLMNEDDPQGQLVAAKAWTRWEMGTSHLVPKKEALERGEVDRFALAFARIESHYFFNKGFFPNDSYLLDNVSIIRHIPAVIVQGRYDVVCPMMSAWDLHKAWPEADLQVIPNAGHSSNEIAITAALVAATEKFKSL